MYEYHVRPALLEVVILIPDHRHILRILASLIVLLPEASVRILVIIRNGNYIGVAFRVLIRCFPYALQGIPHGCLVRQKHYFPPHLDIMSKAVDDTDMSLAQCLVCLVGPDRGCPLHFCPKALMNSVDQFAVALQERDRSRPISLCVFNQVAQGDGSVLAVGQQRHCGRDILFFDGISDFLVGLSQQFHEFLSLLFLGYSHSCLLAPLDRVSRIFPAFGSPGCLGSVSYLTVYIIRNSLHKFPPKHGDANITIHLSSLVHILVLTGAF